MKSTKVEEVAPKPASVVVIDSEDTVEQALKRLVDSGIISAPVIDSKTNGFVGLLDVVDLLAFVVSIFDEKDTEVDPSETNIFKRILSSTKFAQQKISQMDNFKHHQFHPFPLCVDESLYEAMVLFTKKTAHRIPVVSRDGKLLSILTMSACITWLSKHLKELGDLQKKTVSELGIGTSPVYTFNKSAKAIDAFKFMNEKHISGIGIVDNEHKLIGNISARDLRHLESLHIYQMMQSTCGHFVSEIKLKSIEEISPVIAVSKESTFDFIVGKMAVNHIHRIYVLGSDGTATAIISMRDVLKHVMSHLSSHGSKEKQ